jgi:hypothetical protein
MKTQPRNLMALFIAGFSILFGLTRDAYAGPFGVPKLAETSTPTPITATPSLTLDPNATRRQTLVQVTSPDLKGIKQTNGNFKVTFRSQDAFVYRIEYRDDLKTGAWQLAQRGIVADGTTTAWTDDGSFTGGVLLGQRFYRVIAIDRVTRT